MTKVEKVIDAITAKPNISSKEISEATGVESKIVTNILGTLFKEKKISRELVDGKLRYSIPGASVATEKKTKAPKKAKAAKKAKTAKVKTAKKAKDGAVIMTKEERVKFIAKNTEFEKGDKVTFTDGGKKRTGTVTRVGVAYQSDKLYCMIEAGGHIFDRMQHLVAKA